MKNTRKGFLRWSGGALEYLSNISTNWWMQAGLIAFQVRRYFARHTRLAPRKMPGSGKIYLRSFGKRYLLGDTGNPLDLQPLYMFCPIDVDSGSPNPVQTYPLLNKPVATQRPFGLIIILFYFSYNFLIISPLYYLIFLLSPYLAL